MSIDQVVEQARTSDVQLVRFLYCDAGSIVRGKATHVDRLRERLQSGIGLVKGQMAMNILDQLQAGTGLGAVGEVRLVPDLSTFLVLPYAPRSAGVICDLVELDRQPWSRCPRNVLKRQVRKAERLGVHLEASFEPEFMIGRTEDGWFSPVDRALCFSTDGMNRAGAFVHDFITALERQGIGVEQYYPELGHGQHEISVRHAPALPAADRHIWYRETLRGVSFEHRLEATLAPKPFADQPGNGCHLHLSGWNEQRSVNLFYGPDGLSPTGRRFVAGLLAHLPALVALTCPSVNSYRRLKPGAWSSAFVCWGFENREAAVRVPSVYWTREKESTNLELKCVDSSCNPYLALAAVLAAGLDGIERELEPPPPVDFDPGSRSQEELHSRGILRLPVALKEALVELEQDDVLRDALGDDMAQTFLTVKHSECAAFAGHDAEYEMREHRGRF